MHSDKVAIIGAGLSGLALALFLKQHNISCTVYELRSPDATAAGALALAPNSLRSLDSLGLYSRIKQKGCHFRDGTFLNNELEFVDSYELGNADKYGYDGFRVYRQVLLDELRSMVTEAGISIVNGKKFSHIVSEDESGVTYAFADGEQRAAGILIGADGIWSSVRKNLFPEALPSFKNVMTIVCAVPTDLVQLPPKKYNFPMAIQGPAGSFMMAPQNADRSEMLVAVQYRTHERDRSGWDALNSDKQQLLGMLKQDYETWNDTVKTAIDAIDPQTMFIWPFYVVPRLEHWSSAKKRVVLLGDAAHAIPPAGGQGANQAFEDVHSLSLLMAASSEGKVGWETCIDWWQDYRQRRTDGATELTAEMTKRRLPGYDGEGETIDNSWLYNVQIVQDVENWLSSQC